MDKFIARYTDEKGMIRSFSFHKSRFNKEQAEEYLDKKGIQNFFFFFEPNEPTAFGENGIHFQGEIGFDITMSNLMPYVDASNEIILDSFGGDLFEGWKIHDAIKLSGKNPKITILGSCFSAATLVLLATENRHMTKGSRFLIHNPFITSTGDDTGMLEISNMLRIEKELAAKLYSDISGVLVSDIIAIMKEERFIYLNEAIEMNFVKNENLEIKEDEEMNAEQEAKLNSISDGIKALGNGIKNLLIKPVKNVLVQDVNGTEIDFGDSAETVEQISVGDTATVDGSAANGEYTLQDGTVYVFEDGTLTEIREPETEEAAEDTALQVENEALSTENEELKNSITAKDTLYNDLKAKSEEVESTYNTLNKEFTEFKNRFSDEKEEIKTPGDKDEVKKGLKFNKNKLRNG